MLSLAPRLSGGLALNRMHSSISLGGTADTLESRQALWSLQDVLHGGRPSSNPSNVSPVGTRA